MSEKPKSNQSWCNTLGASGKCKRWIEMANKQYESRAQLKEYQRIVAKDKDLQKIEQQWVDTYMTPIVDIMGGDMWDAVTAKVYGMDGRASTRARAKIAPENEAVFSGAHWRSRKAGEEEWFDPYDVYQIKGTNQFCQTYAMMYLLNSLPSRGLGKWTDYYLYTKGALEFIEYALESHAGFPDQLKLLKSAMKTPNIFLNVVELP